MTRTIKAREIKEGMTVQLQVGVDFVREHRDWVTFFRDDGRSVGLDGDVEVEVLSEPQLEEPTKFGARVVVAGRRFLRSPVVMGDSAPWLEENGGIWRDWDDLCEMGLVQVVPDQGWTALDDTPEVPERVEKWPEDDSALRKYKWVDRDADTWTWTEAQAKWECRNQRGECYMARSRPSSWFGPWTRVTDA